MTKEAGERQEPPVGAGPVGPEPDPRADAPGVGTGEPERPGAGDSGDGVAPPPTAGERPPLGVIDWIYGLLFRPWETMERLAAGGRPPLALAAGVVSFVMLVGSLDAMADVTRVLQAGGELPLGSAVELPAAGPGGGVPAVGGAWLALLAVPVGLAFWFSLAAVYHLGADLLGGRGDGRRLLAAIGLASLPEAFRLPAGVLASRLPVAGGLVESVAGVAFFAWSFYLVYLALRATKGLTPGRAVFTAFLPLLALVALFILVIVATLFSAILAAGMA